MAAEAALRHKGLAYERIDFEAGPHIARMQEIYGDGHATVPGLLIDDEPVHGSRAILARLDEIAPQPPLYPEPIGDEVREAERWGDEEFQDLGRSLPWERSTFGPRRSAPLAGPGRSTVPGPTSLSGTSTRPGATTSSPQPGCTTTWPRCRRSWSTSTSWWLGA